ncbi:MAG: T9SS type A sorting domain-containing protein [Saprospiraceae bacterium]
MKVKNIFLNSGFLSLFLLVSIMKIDGQSLHIDYIQTEGTPYHFKVEVWVSNQTDQPMKLSALNTVFNYIYGSFEEGAVSFDLASKYRFMVSPQYSNLTEQNKIRSTQVPVLNAQHAIQVGSKPELFGTLTFKTKTEINYPKSIIPSTKGNPTVQAIVYLGESINSNALTLSNMSITTDENPLVLKLMPAKINSVHQSAELTIYPNPTNQAFTYELLNMDIEQETILNISDVNGQSILSKDISSQTSGYVDLTNIPSGLYYIRIENDSVVYYKKLLKIE